MQTKQEQSWREFNVLCDAYNDFAGRIGTDKCLPAAMQTAYGALLKFREKK